MPAKVQVLIWSFGGLRHPSRFGHAAVRLRNVQGVNEPDVYISWWPGKKRGGKLGQGHQPWRRYEEDVIAELSPSARGLLTSEQSNPRKGQSLITYHGRPRDIEVGKETVRLNKGDKVWVKKPDFTLDLPVQQQDGKVWGLDAIRMYEWWIVFSNAPNTQYKAVSTSNNCASVALYALTAGGAEKLCHPPRALAFLDPNEICKYVQDLQKQINMLNETTTELNIPVRENPLGLESRVEFSQHTDLPTFDEWYTKSEVGMSWYDRRKEQVLEIDKLLQKYRRFPWVSQFASTKFAILVEMMGQVHSHMAHKPNSDRGDAVRWMGRHILHTYYLKSQQFEQPEKIGDWMQISFDQFVFIGK